MVNKKYLNIFLAVLWMVFIFIMSSLEGDVSNARSYFIVDIFKSIGVTTSTEDGAILNFIIRKSGHFIEYFILAILMYNALIDVVGTKYIIILTIFCVFLYGCGDEIHQLFVVGREGKFSDVIIDTLGGAVGVLFYKVVNFIVKIYKNK